MKRSGVSHARRGKAREVMVRRPLQDFKRPPCTLMSLLRHQFGQWSSETTNVVDDKRTTRGRKKPFFAAVTFLFVLTEEHLNSWSRFVFISLNSWLRMVQVVVFSKWTTSSPARVISELSQWKWERAFSAHFLRSSLSHLSWPEVVHTIRGNPETAVHRDHHQLDM